VKDDSGKKKENPYSKILFKKSTNQLGPRRSIGGAFAGKVYTTSKVKTNNFINHKTAQINSLHSLS
jgi:hypothetical protein